jgi:hypothetical protein
LLSIRIYAAVTTFYGTVIVSRAALTACLPRGVCVCVHAFCAWQDGTHSLTRSLTRSSGLRLITRSNTVPPPLRSTRSQDLGLFWLFAILVRGNTSKRTEMRRGLDRSYSFMLHQPEVFSRASVYCVYNIAPHPLGYVSMTVSPCYFAR